MAGLLGTGEWRLGLSHDNPRSCNRIMTDGLPAWKHPLEDCSLQDAHQTPGVLQVTIPMSMDSNNLPSLAYR